MRHKENSGKEEVYRVACGIRRRVLVGGGLFKQGR